MEPEEKKDQSVSTTKEFPTPKVIKRETTDNGNTEVLYYDNGMVQRVIGFKVPLA